jgi:hypothetical protein
LFLMVKMHLGLHPWLRTSPLPVTHAGIGNRPGHSPGPFGHSTGATSCRTSGSRRVLLPSRPLRTVRESCPLTRLKQTTCIGRLRLRTISRFGGPFAEPRFASNFSSDQQPSRPSLGGSPGPRQPPFGVGQCPIHQVMTSPCLSAGGLRFWDRPVPAEEFRLPCGWPTGRARLHRGYHVPHQ